jgi:hypothetical protein
MRVCVCVRCRLFVLHFIPAKQFLVVIHTLPFEKALIYVAIRLFLDRTDECREGFLLFGRIGLFAFGKYM